MQRVRLVANDPENNEMCVVRLCVGVNSHASMLVSKHMIHSHDRGNIYFLDTTGRISFLREFACSFSELADVHYCID